MNKLNRKLNIEFENNLPVKVLQFGEGNFLRAFFDFLIDSLNDKNLFNGQVEIIQPINQGMVETLNEQDGLYTLIERGIQNGKIINEKKIIKSVSKGINPYVDFDTYIKCIKNPDLRIIVSNTTESGICFNEEEKLDGKVQNTFPAKITSLLFERYKTFNGDITKGLIFIPCELIDNNGTNLKKYVLKYAEIWNLEKEFIDWINNANYFTNTLVDRIVTGYPKDEIDDLKKELGYIDNLIDTCEIFYLFVIEGPKEIREELPFEKANLNVIWTDDSTDYKVRKVRILNGGHTMSVFTAFLYGKNTVLEMVSEENLKTFLKRGIFEEIIPTLNLNEKELVEFANDVLERFENPFIKHNLLSISLNSIAKFKVRVLPSILEFVKRKKFLPKYLTFSFASLLAFYKGTNMRNKNLVGNRFSEEYIISDDEEILTYFKDLWENAKIDDKNDISKIVSKVNAKLDFWDMDLNKIEGFNQIVTEHLFNILNGGMEKEVKKIVKG